MWNLEHAKLLIPKAYRRIQDAPGLELRYA